MEVKPAYKQTEVGVIPEDWKVCPLTSIADVRDGTHDSPRYLKSGVPFVTSKNIVSGKVNLKDITFISEEDAREVNKRSKVDRNDILLSMIGTVGNAALVDFEPDFCIKNVALIKLDSSKANSSFLIQLLRSDHYARYIENKLEGGIQKFISLGVLRALDVPLPPTKAEQEAIAEALSDGDALIESMEQLIAKKRQIKQGAMQDLLTGKKRLPGFSREWEVKRLGECLISRPDYGINAAAVSYSDRLPTYIRITDISDDGSFAPNSLVSVAHPDAPQYYLIHGDLVFARTGASVGKSYLYNPRDGRLVFAGFLIRVRPDPSRLIPAFLSYFVQTSSYWNWVKVMSMRSGQPGINGNEFAQLSLLCPSVAEQTAIANILSDMDAEIAALEEKLAKARNLKQGMMQELLTGRIRVV